MISQPAQVISGLRSGDRVYAHGANCPERLYSFGCATAFGPILIADTLVFPAWSQVTLLPPF